jgi:hypothetical protein
MENTSDKKGPMMIALDFCAVFAVASNVAHLVAFVCAIAVCVISFLHNWCASLVSEQQRLPAAAQRIVRSRPVPVGRSMHALCQRSPRHAPSSSLSPSPHSCPTGKCPPILPVLTVALAGLAHAIALAIQVALLAQWLIGPGRLMNNLGYSYNVAYYCSLAVVGIDALCVAAYASRIEMRLRTCCAGRDHCCAKC